MDAAGALTIEDLAARTGMTVRNIRAHQTRGLLPPPLVRGRTGFYSPEHIARLELIREMQGSGFNLKAIKQLLDATPEGAGEEVLRLERLLMAPWEEERSEIISAADLATRFGGDAKATKRAVELGIVIPMGDGRFEVPSPGLLRAGEDVIAMGVPLDHALAVLEKVVRNMRGVAQEFVRLFLRDVWRPFVEAGMPQDQLTPVRESLERLRAVAWEVVRPVFQRTMSTAVEEAFGKELRRLG
ncbi:MAG TPA: MerR family transcriptional regulator [Actinomycetota bacterium]|nr:MerR family transcriptional regulator [Actinomycetota bacterium]